MSLLFVTGTDTGVGKTVATAALASHARQAGLDVAVCKPAQTGTADGDDDLAEIGRLAGVTRLSSSAATFAAIRWRVAEITPASVTPDLKTPRRYEIEPSWESPVLTTFNHTISIPGDVLRGHDLLTSGRPLVVDDQGNIPE